MIIKFAKGSMKTEVADDFSKRFWGLCFGKKRNMLFSMDYDHEWPFWMFLVRYDLRIIFIDRNKRVVDIKDARPISLDPATWRTYTPKKPARYILETPFPCKIRMGDRLIW
jgi:uncharacterized membrane protein (UPF0127 family)